MTENISRETQLLCDIAARVGATLDADELLIDLAAPVAQLLGAEAVLTWLPDAAKTRLLPHQPSSYGLPKTAYLPGWPVDDNGIVAGIYRTGRSFYSNDVLNDSRLVHRDALYRREVI